MRKRVTGSKIEGDELEVIEKLQEMPDHSSVALGFFDGVHSAHAQVIQAAVGNLGSVSSVLTFRLEGDAPKNKLGVKLLLTPAQKLERLEALGAERVYLPNFSEISGLSPEDFFYKILLEKLHTTHISCGFDYTFGKDARGTPLLLKQLCATNGVKLHILPPYEKNGVPVSSTRIRSLITEGRIPEANSLLGYDYFILGEVIHGRSLGRTLGFPTLNQRLFSTQVIPKYGVYNSLTQICGRTCRSITNVGVKPTIEGSREPLAETYLLDTAGDFYGKTARVELLEMTRPEQRFSDLSELRDAVSRDIAARRSAER